MVAEERAVGSGVALLKWRVGAVVHGESCVTCDRPAVERGRETGIERECGGFKRL